MKSEMKTINGKDIMVYFVETNSGRYGFKKLTMGEKMAMKKKLSHHIKMKTEKSADINIEALFEQRLNILLKNIIEMPNVEGIPTQEQFENLADPDDFDVLMGFIEELTEPKKKSQNS